jgi:hypothetical protein
LCDAVSRKNLLTGCRDGFCDAVSRKNLHTGCR